MSQYLSDDEVFGSSKPGSGYLSDDEVLGLTSTAGAGRGSVNPPAVVPSGEPSYGRTSMDPRRLDLQDDAAPALPDLPLAPQASVPVRVEPTFVANRTRSGSVLENEPEPIFDQITALRDSRRAKPQPAAANGPVRELKPSAPIEERSLVRAAGDTALGLYSGAMGLAKGAADNVNAGDNPVSSFIESAQSGARRLMSPDLRDQLIKRESRILTAQRNQGELAGARAAWQSLFDFPAAGLDTAAQGAGSLIPSILLGVSGASPAVLSVVNAASVAGEGAERTAKKLRELSPAVWAEDAAYQQLTTEAGASHAEAVALLAPLRAVPAQMAGAVAGAISGRVGFEGVLTGRAVSGSLRARTGRAGGELGTEQLETILPGAVANTQIGAVDGKTSWFEGLGRDVVDTAVGTVPGAALAASAGAPREPKDQAARALADMLNGVGFSPLPDAGGASLNPNLANTLRVENQPTVPVAPTGPVPPATARSRPLAPATDEKTGAVNAIERILASKNPASAPAAAPTGAADVSTTMADGQQPAGSPASGGVDIAGSTQSGGLRTDAGGRGAPAAAAPAPSSSEAVAVGDAAVRAEPVATLNDSGTLTIKGEPKSLIEMLRAGGVVSILPASNGVVVGKNQAEQALSLVTQNVQNTAQTSVPAPAPAAASAAPADPRGAAGDVAAAPVAGPAVEAPGLSDEQRSVLVEALGDDFERAYQQDIKDAILEKRGMKPEKVEDRQNTPLRAFLRSVGLAPELAPDIVGERGLRANNVLPNTFRRGGLDLDMLVERAVEQGFLSQQEVDADSIDAGNKLIEMIQADVRGERQVSAGMADQEYAAQAAARVSDELQGAASAIGFDTTGLDDGQVAAALKRITRRRVNAQLRMQKFDAALEAQDERAALDIARAVPADIIDELIVLAEQEKKAQNRDYIDALLAGLETENAATQERSQEGRPGSGRPVGAAERAPAESAQTGQGNPAREAGQAEGLTRPTADQVVAAQDRASNAQALDERDQIDRESSGQTLTSQTAPEQRTDTSSDMFAREKAEAEIAKRNAGKPKDDNGTASMFEDRTGPDVQRELEPWEVALAPSLATALRRWQKGRVGDKTLAAAVRAELDGRRAKRESATAADRVRGADWIRERLLRARRVGELSEAQVDLAMWMLDQAPQLATDLGISIRAGNLGTPNGQYNLAERVVTIFADKANDETATHEILHHSERMMPPDVQAGIRREWLRQLERGVAKAKKTIEARRAAPTEKPGWTSVDTLPDADMDQKRLELLDMMLLAARNGDADITGILWKKGTGDGVNLQALVPYELSQPSEFWAVNGAALMREKAEAEGDWVAKAKLWLKGLIERAKELLRLPSDAPVLRGLRAVMEGDGSRQSGMISRQGATFEDRTDTPAFKAWFGESKVVDAEGKPLEVYHGTASDFSTFRTAPGWYGTGIYLTDNPNAASTYADERADDNLDGDGANVMPVYVRMEKPYRFEPSANGVASNEQLLRKLKFTSKQIEAASREYVQMADLAVERLQEQGYDGLIVGDEYTGEGREFIAFDPSQIKSATGNRGTFDDGNDDIRFARPPQPNTPAHRAARSIWLDDTGRLQFAPGAVVDQWLKDGFVGKILSRAYLRTASPAMRKQLRAMKLAVQDAQDKAVEVARAAQAMDPDERAMVSDVIEQELTNGVVPPVEVMRMASVMSTAMAEQTMELIDLGMLSQEAAARWDGKYLPRYYAPKLGKTLETAWEKSVRSLTRKPSPLTGIRGKHLKGRGLYATASAGELQNWLDLGYEIRDPDLDPAIKTMADVQALISGGTLDADSEVQVWRDFTRDERDDMGEIRDASLRFTLGYMETQRDIALGRMFEAMAADPELSSKTATDKHTERVPDGTLEGSGARKYGKLGGRYISRDDFSQLDNATGIEGEFFKAYKAALAVWKEGKTVANPVAHFNNMVSNMSMAHFAGVSYWDAHKYTGALYDFARGTPSIKQARDAGLFLGTVSDEELRNMLPQELRKLVVQTEGMGRRTGRSAINILMMGLRTPLNAAYKAEDLFFRYLIWKDATGRGMDAEDAVDYAQKFIFDYSDLPKTARGIRDFGIPFFSYTYKFIPAFVSTALTHPTRLAAPSAVLWGLQAMAYGLLAAGDDEDEGVLKSIWMSVTDPVRRDKAIKLAKEEAQNLPEWMKGKTALGTPRAIRLQNDKETGLPSFIDVSRIVPGGDIFDVHANAGGVPFLQWMTPNNPLLTTFGAMFLNRDAFTGKDVVDKDIDTDGEAASKRGAWLWKQFTPAIAAGNYHWERLMQAAATANGGELPSWVPDLLGGDSTGVGKDGVAVTPTRAALNTMGIKIRPMDLERSESINESQKRRQIRELDARVRSLQRQHMNGAVSERALDKEREMANVKKDRLRDGKDVDGDDKD